MAQVTAAGMRVGYDRIGDGPDVVLIHGGFADRRMWGRTPEDLAARFRVTTYDLRGHGETGPSGYAVYSADLFARDLVALMDALGIARAHVVGLSLGGVVAQVLAARHPERVDRLVLGSAMVRHDLTRTDRIATYFPFISPSLTLRAIGPLPMAWASLHLLRTVRGHGWMSASGETRAFLLDLARRMDRTEYVKVLRALYRNQGVDLGTIAAPTLVLTGGLETDTLKQHAEVLARDIPGARHAEIAGAGHIMNLDAPDAFAALVGDFLSAKS